MRILRELVFGIMIAATSTVSLADDPRPPAGVEAFRIPDRFEASGVAAAPPEVGGFVVVGDDSNKKGRLYPQGGKWRLSRKTDGRKTAKGPEGIDIAASDDGTSVSFVIGEDNRTLSTNDGRNYKLPKAFREKCGRGAEGLTVRWKDGAWDILVLWEGGYFECKPHEFALPKILRLTWPVGAAQPIKGEVTELQVGGFDLQGKLKFRAPDLSWYPASDQIAVLLQSTSKKGKKSKHTWLQMFDLTGVPVAGKQLRLEDAWGKFAKLNWEGMDYTWDGSRVAMVNDDLDRDRPEWLALFPDPFR